MKAIIFDVDGTLTESMSVDTELYFSSIYEILGPVKIRRNLDSYEHVTDSGILAQVLRDNGIAYNNEIAASIQNVFIERLRTHIDSVAPFPAIDGAVDYLKRAHESGNTRIAIATGGWRRSG